MKYCQMANNHINSGLGKAAPLRYATFPSRLCGALGLRRSEVYNQFFDYAAFKGWICESSLLYRWYESQRSHACCTFNQNSGEFPKRRDNLSAIAGLIARRSLNISFIVWRDTPKAFAMEAVLRP